MTRTTFYNCNGYLYCNWGGRKFSCGVRYDSIPAGDPRMDLAKEKGAGATDLDHAKRLVRVVLSQEPVAFPATFLLACQLYLESQTDLADSSYRIYAYAIESYHRFTEQYGDLDPMKLRLTNDPVFNMGRIQAAGQHFTKYKAWLQEKDYALRTQRKYLIVLTQAANWLAGQYGISIPDVIPTIQVDNHNLDIPMDAIRAVLTFQPQVIGLDAEVWLGARIQIQSTLRFSDLMAITPEQIQGEVLRIRNAKTRQLTYHYIGDLLPEIQAQFSRYDELFPLLKAGTTWNATYNERLSAILRPCEGLDVEVEVQQADGTYRFASLHSVLTSHTLRAMGATMYANSGMGLHQVSTMTGHKAGSTTLQEIYAGKDAAVVAALAKQIISSIKSA